MVTKYHFSGYADFCPKICLNSHSFLGNSTTHITITQVFTFLSDCKKNGTRICRMSRYKVWQECLVSFDMNSLQQAASQSYKSQVPYSREQKHVLLFRKSEILLFKVSITNMPHIFFRNKTFLFVVQMSWKKRYLTNAWCVCQVSFFSAHSDNFYFLTPHVTNWI